MKGWEGNLLLGRGVGGARVETFLEEGLKWPVGYQLSRGNAKTKMPPLALGRGGEQTANA